MGTFQQLCDMLELCPRDYEVFYKQLKLRLLSWKAQSLWTRLDKRAAHWEYRKGAACSNTKVRASVQDSTLVWTFNLQRNCNLNHLNCRLFIFK